MIYILWGHGTIVAESVFSNISNNNQLIVVADVADNCFMASSLMWLEAMGLAQRLPDDIKHASTEPEKHARFRLWLWRVADEVEQHSASLAEAQTWAKVKFSLRGANLVEQDAAALLSHAFGTNVYVMTDVAKVLDAVQITKYPGMCSQLQFDLAVELQGFVNELLNACGDIISVAHMQLWFGTMICTNHPALV